MKKQLLLTFLFLNQLILAQVNPKTRWGNVSNEEIAFKEVSFEKEADAAILWESGYLNLKFPLETFTYRRIKILSQEGKKYANQRFVFQHYNKLENIFNIKAQTLNQENGKTVSYSVKKDDIHFNKLNDYHTEVVFTFPNVQVGAIIEFEMTFQRRNMNWIEAWQFQHEIPTMYSEISINPEASYSGFSTMVVGENISKNNKKEVSGGNVHKYKLSNLPSYTTHKFVYNQKSLADRILLQLKSYYDYKDTYTGDQIVLKQHNQTWELLSRDMYHRFQTFVAPGAVKDLLKSVSKGSSQRDYLQNIVTHFKNNYRWNKTYIYGGIPEKTNREILNQKTGCNTDLNALLYAYLKEAGFKTEYVVASSRQHGQLITSYPYVGQFDISFNFVTLDSGETFLLDASDLSNELGYMPLNNYNHLGMVLDPKKETFINVEPPLSEFYVTQNYNFTNDKINFVHNEKRRGYTPNFYKATDPSLIDINFDEKDGIAPKLGDDNYWVARRIFQSDLNLKEFITIKNPFFELMKFYEFSQNSRNTPIELDFPYIFKIQSVIKLPQGYKAEVPANFNSTINDKDKNLIYAQKAEIAEDKLTINYELFIKKSVLVNQYKEVKEFFTKAQSASHQYIILKKN